MSEVFNLSDKGRREEESNKQLGESWLAAQSQWIERALENQYEIEAFNRNHDLHGEAIVHLLTAIRHYCESNALDFGQLSEQAAFFYYKKLAFETR
jgi:hypothetical protein